MLGCRHKFTSHNFNGDDDIERHNELSIIGLGSLYHVVSTETDRKLRSMPIFEISQLDCFDCHVPFLR